MCAGQALHIACQHAMQWKGDALIPGSEVAIGKTVQRMLHGMQYASSPDNVIFT